MQDEQRRKVLKSFQLVLRPIVKILLRYSIGFNEFAEAVKTAYVDVATSEFGIRGRPTNISRVAVMTGLTRKEVRRLRTKIESGEDHVSVKSTPITEILHRWHAEDEFLDDNKKPARLPFAGEEKSFSSLVRKFGGDVPPGAMRTELKRVGSIEERSNGDLEVKLRSFWPADETSKLESALIHHAYPLMSSICHNTDPSTDATDGIMAQFSAYSIRVRESDRPRVRRVCTDRIIELSKSFDDLLTAYEDKSVDDTAGNQAPVAVGLYYFEERDKNAKYDW